MAKRTSRSQASDTATASPPAQKSARSAPRARKTESADPAPDTFAVRDAAIPVQVDDEEERTDDQPSEEEIRHRAYLRYLERGGEHGADFEDWLHAERELKEKKRGR